MKRSALVTAARALFAVLLFLSNGPVFSSQVAPPRGSVSADLPAATALYEKADYAAAAPALERVLAAGTGLSRPDRLRAREMLVVSYFALNEPAKLSAAIRALLRESPTYEPRSDLPPEVRGLIDDLKRDAASRAAIEGEAAKLRPNVSALEGEIAKLRSAVAAVETELAKLRIEWVDIPAGSFEMGCSVGWTCNDDERQRHRVTLAAFRLMATEVTRGMYREYQRAAKQSTAGPLEGTVANMPHDAVTWEEAGQFCQWVNGRLPTEAEWEYAARAGTSTRFWWGDKEDPAKAHLRTGEKPEAVPVDDAGRRNPWGLADMLGNVWELTSSEYRPYPYSPTDGREGSGSNVTRVMRGGSWNDSSTSASNRHVLKPGERFLGVGFRCAQSGSSRNAAALTAVLAKATNSSAPSPSPSSPPKGSDPATPLSIQWADIPAGSFEMGCGPSDKSCDDDESPRHRVTLQSFRMMQTEVTVGMFQKYASATKVLVPQQLPGMSLADSPVVNITWAEARTFCQWAGGRLPSEAEWEYAARGGTSQPYWWGQTVDNTRAVFNVKGPAAVGIVARRNPFGLYDVLGNVSEWTSSLVRAYPYRADDGRENETASGSRVVRGGSWSDNDPKRLRVSYRYYTTAANVDVREPHRGFRCVHTGTR